VKTDARRDTPDTSSRDAGRHPAADSEHDVDWLLPLALSQPMLAREHAESVLRTSTNAHARSVAYQALAIVHRDQGDLAHALSDARNALRVARRCDNPRIADVLATYGLTLVHAGKTTAGLQRLSEAEAFTPTDRMPRLLLRRAQALYVVGRYADSVAALDVAVDGSHEADDRLWEARGLNNRCVAHLALGDVAAADADARRAEALFDALDQRLESAHSIHNRAITAHVRGDVVEALTVFDDVTLRYAAIGVLPGDLVIDHAQALLTAGLTAEARAMTESALTADMPPAKHAEVSLTAAQAALAEGDVQTASRHAASAGQLFSRQQRPVWARRARLLALQTQYLADHPELLNLADVPTQVTPRPRQLDPRGRRVLRQIDRLVADLTDDHALEVPLALLLQGRIAQDRGDIHGATTSLTSAAEARHDGSALAQSAAWLAAALLADIRGDRRALLHACRRGLDAVDAHRALLGDLELRALAARHGNELATLAVRTSLGARDARRLLWWVERWRATALVTPQRGAVDDPEVDRQIAALRDVSRRLDMSDEHAASALQQERQRHEAVLRKTYHHRRGHGPASVPFDLDSVITDLGSTVLVVLVAVDQVLYVVTVADGRVSRRVVGGLAAALHEARFARFALRRAAVGRVPDLDSTSARLQSALLGSAFEPWTRAHVVLVPPADLLTAPWGLLPVFRESTLTVSPSTSLWNVARVRSREGGHIALVSGPGLSTGEAEVTTLSPLYRDARPLSGDSATVAAALEVLEGARLAHVAAHGTFRADAPLFSSLRLHDGPMTVYDMDRLARPPVEVVLSACDSGNAAPIGPHEALGLVSSLLAMGTRTVLASVVPVNDRATLGVMRDVHAVVGRGGTLAEGWLAARQAAVEADDPLARATADAFVAWGA
jgi:tetratricopeptide (TPR) repeat protein